MKKIIAIGIILAMILCIVCPLISGAFATDKPKVTILEMTVQKPSPAPREITKRTPYEELLLGSSIPLDVDHQITIYGLCDCDREKFCAAMAIAAVETDGKFDLDEIGDKGTSYGLFQINIDAQADELKKLEIEDPKELFDPKLCGKAAVSYINWLTERLDVENLYGSHKFYMAYNGGLVGSQRSISKGVTDTEYSRRAVRYYNEFLAEVERRFHNDNC